MLKFSLVAYYPWRPGRDIEYYFLESWLSYPWNTVLRPPTFSYVMQDMPGFAGPYHKSSDVVMVTINSIG